MLRTLLRVTDPQAMLHGAVEADSWLLKARWELLPWGHANALTGL